MNRLPRSISLKQRGKAPGPGNRRPVRAFLSTTLRGSGKSRSLNHPTRDSSLSIVLFALFVICICAQSFAGWRLQNETFAAHGQSSVGYWHFLSTGAFLDGLASNWQAAVLQLGSLIVFSGFLYQRGAPHSRDPGKAKPQIQAARSSPFHLVLPQFAVAGVFAAVCARVCAACRLRD